MVIYVVLGIFKGDDAGFIEILRAFTVREKADNYYENFEIERLKI